MCWVEIPARDPWKLKAFYAAAFPNWSFREETSKDESGGEVIHFSVGKPDGVGGGIVQMPKDLQEAEQPLGAGMTVYYFVNSIEETQEHIKKLGGRTVLEKQPQGEHGWYANLVDVEGNRFGIYQLRPEMLED